MNRLPADITRCHGENTDGDVCPVRKQCMRYRARFDRHARAPTTMYACESGGDFFIAACSNYSISSNIPK